MFERWGVIAVDQSFQSGSGHCEIQRKDCQIICKRLFFILFFVEKVTVCLYGYELTKGSTLYSKLLVKIYETRWNGHKKIDEYKVASLKRLVR